MAFAALNPLAALWRQRGLTCLLMPPGFDAFAPTPPTATAAAQAVPARDLAAPNQRRQNPPRPVRSAATGPSDRDRPAATRPQQRAAVHAFPSEAVPAPASAVDAPWRPSPPPVRPAPWPHLLGQTRPGHIVWTYWSLGPDIRDPATPGRAQRRAFLQRLLHDLGHPAGTHTFWPVCLPPDPDALPPVPEDTALGALEKTPPAPAYAPAPDVFWSGARQLRARGVVVLGSVAGQAAGLPGGLRPLQQLRHRGQLVWVLWDVENLLAQEQRYASMLAFLRQAFVPVLR